MTNLEQLKKQYESGDWVCYVTDRHDSPWEKFENYKKPELFVFDSEILVWKLIHNRHSHIADSVIANPDVEVEQWANPHQGWIEDTNFFSNYQDWHDYRIKEPKQESIADIAIKYIEAKQASKQDFNGGYILASQEAFKLLLKANLVYENNNIDENVFIVDGNIFYPTYIAQQDTTLHKQFYINNGALSWIDPTSMENQDEGEEDATNMDNGCNINDSSDCVNNSSTSRDALSITDSEGKEYKFEKPNFYCELLKIVNDDDGTQVVGYIVDAGQVQPIVWNMNGIGYTNFHREDKYELVPIKPKWYKDEYKPNRVEVIGENGRDYSSFLKEGHYDIHIQDDGRTIKLFQSDVKEGEEDV